MAESGRRDVNVCSEEQKSETKELCGRSFQGVSSTRAVQVVTVRPLLRNGNFDGQPRTASSPSPSPSPSSPASRTPPSSHDRFSPRRWIPTRPQPFSFDERDSMQRVARKQRLEELRQEEERHMMAMRFRANPVRRYKPLVLMQSTRPLTVPRAPFSR